jgi:hypothetical protein
MGTERNQFTSKVSGFRLFVTSIGTRRFLNVQDPRLYAPEGDTPMESTWERVAPA